MKKQSVPRYRRWILSLFADDELCDSVMEDLDIQSDDKGFPFKAKTRLKNFFRFLIILVPFAGMSIVGSAAMFRSYMKTFRRHLTRNRGYSFINIAGLSLGMACCLVIGLYVRNELSFDRFHSKGNRIYRLVENQFFEGQEHKQLGQSTYWMGETFLQYPEVAAAVNFIDIGTIWIRRGEEALEIRRPLLADPEVFSMFSFKLKQGNAETALSEPDSVVVTEETAQRLCGDTDPMGQTFVGPYSKDCTITGVVENVPPNSHLQFDMLISMEDIRRRPVDWNNYNHDSPTYLLLKENVDPDLLEGKLKGHVKKYFRHNADFVSLSLQPLYDIHLRSKKIMWEINAEKGDMSTVYFYSVIMIFILLIACFNHINLTTARSMSRAREVGIRKVVGAGRKQLIRQFMGESVLFSLCALLLSLVLAVAAKPVLIKMLGGKMVFGFLDDGLFLVVLLLVLLAAGIAAGLYPAFILSSFLPATVLKKDDFKGYRGAGLRKILVMAQFAVSTLLILSTLVVTRQWHYMQRKDTGYDMERVVTLPMTEDMQEHFDAIRAELQLDSRLSGVTASTRKPGASLWRNRILFDGIDPKKQWISPYMTVDVDFLSFYRMELAAGRGFSREFADDVAGRSYIINETLAAEIGWENPIGKKFRLGDFEWGTVVGVVKDYNFRSLHHKIEPVVLFIHRPWFYVMSIRLAAGDTSRILADLKEKLSPYRSLQPIEFTFLDADYARLYENEKRSGGLFGVFSLLAVLISCLGLFALTSFTVEQKTKEIGVRKVLGASVFGIVTSLSWKFTIWVILANVFALPAAWFVMHGWLHQFAYRVPLGIDVFVFSSAAVLMIALSAVFFKVFRAAVSNPVHSLRYE